jgi:hypothetical protein
MPDRPTVFISYAHESEEHAARVLAFADQLVGDGVEVILDQYSAHPADGWPLWMQRGLDRADFVLMLCSPAYRRRVMRQEEAGRGLGVQWEGNLIYNRLYGNLSRGDKLIPILMAGFSADDIPEPAAGFARYEIAAFDLSDRGYERLYRHLTNQPATPMPAMGSIKKLSQDRNNPTAQDCRVFVTYARRISRLGQSAVADSARSFTLELRDELGRREIPEAAVYGTNFSAAATAFPDSPRDMPASLQKASFVVFLNDDYIGSRESHEELRRIRDFVDWRILSDRASTRRTISAPGLFIVEESNFNWRPDSARPGDGVEMVRLWSPPPGVSLDDHRKNAIGGLASAIVSIDANRTHTPGARPAPGYRPTVLLMMNTQSQEIVDEVTKRINDKGFEYAALDKVLETNETFKKLAGRSEVYVSIVKKGRQNAAAMQWDKFRWQQVDPTLEERQWHCVLCKEEPPQWAFAGFGGIQNVATYRLTVPTQYDALDKALDEIREKLTAGGRR